MASKVLFPRRILVVRWDLTAPYLSSAVLHGFLEWLEPRFQMIFGIFGEGGFFNDNLVGRIWSYPVISDALLPLLTSTEDSDVTVISFTSPFPLVGMGARRMGGHSPSSRKSDIRGGQGASRTGTVTPAVNRASFRNDAGVQISSMPFIRNTHDPSEGMGPVQV